jgi:hypothetical protein
MAIPYEKASKIWGSTKYGGTIDHLGDYELLKNNYALWK